MQELDLAVSSTTAAQLQADRKRMIVTETRRDFCQKTGMLAAMLKTDAYSSYAASSFDWVRYEALLSAPQPSTVIEQLGRDFYRDLSALYEQMEAERNAALRSNHQHNAIAGYVSTLREKTALAESQLQLLADLRSALDIVMQQRKDYVEAILATISTEAEALYAQLHPGEGIGQLKFRLNPRTMGSLEFDAQFHDASALPPQAYYSESHLDTLGICVFLALAKHFKTDNTVVVLDDVLTSVDGPHLGRFMTLLHDQSKHFNQVIVTTHYRPWRDRYRWAKGPTANTQVVELGPWSLQNGLQTGEFLTAVAELSATLAKPMLDRQAAASKAGIVLESLLDFVTLKYRCAISRNARNEYTLGDLVGGVDSKLGKELCCHKPSANGGPKTEVHLKPLIDAATASQWIRNSVGCHFNALGGDVYDNDVKDFCEHVLTLASHLICATCGTLPTRRPQGLYWECKCGALELYPLIYPGADPRTVDEDES